MAKFIDISHMLDEKTPVFPGDERTSLVKRKDFGKDGFTAFSLTASMHTGTHIDFPMHLLDDTRTAAVFPVSSFCCGGTVLDVRGENPVKLRPEYADMDFCGRAVLLLTGFGKRYGSGAYFEEYPAVDMELARFFVERKIGMLGADTPSPDYPPFEVHKLLLSNGIYILENLANLEAIPGAAEFEVYAFPLRIGAEASPTRAVCRVF